MEATVAEPAAPEVRADEPGHRRGGVRRWLAWVVRPQLCFGGIVVALVFAWYSLTPSLLPRTWLFQGVVSGVAVALGYGVGSALSALVRQVLPREREPSPEAKRFAWKVLAGVGGLVTLVMLVTTMFWQDSLRERMGMDLEGRGGRLGIVVVTLLVGALLLVAARLVRSFTRFLIRQIDRVAPRPVSVGVGVALGALVVFGFVQGFLWRGVVATVNQIASVADGGTPDGATRPTTELRSGGPGSLVSWESLGNQGRGFIGRGPSVGDLEAFHGGGCCEEPIRVYVGLDAADTAEEGAALAVRELERTGAFEREVLVVFTTTGSGWVNPRSADAVEYLHRGDTAAVALQYSYLPSWMSFLTDRTKAAEAGRALIGAVLDRVDRLPAATRPQVLLYGESLGSYGTESAFADIAELRARADGALLVGPTFSNPLWGRLTDDREAGSPEWLPRLPDDVGVRFARRPADLEGFAVASPGSRVVYLQNSSDPITWFAPDLAVREPAWAGEPAAPDRAPEFRWFPLVTFFQVAMDMADSLGVPEGYGHDYGANVVDGWLAVLPPSDWSPDDTRRLRAVVNGEVEAKDGLDDGGSGGSGGSGGGGG